MTSVSFFTPIVHANPIPAEQFAENYFSLWGKTAYVIAGRMNGDQECVVIREEKNSPSFLVTALKVLSYCTIIIPLIFLALRTIYRCFHKFEVIDPKTELERGIEVTPDQIAMLRQLAPVIKNGEDHPEIEWLTKNHTKVFRLAAAPHLVFKINTAQNVSTLRNGRMMGPNELMQDRFENTLKGKEVCLIHQLDHLVIPQTKIFDLDVEGESLKVIVEQSLNILGTDSAQEELYRTQAQALNKAVQQLAIFISKTDFNDVIWRNIPVIDGTSHVGLPDIEHMERARGGFLGDINGSVGLIGCVFTGEQIDLVIQEARKCGIENLEKIKTQRLEEIGEYDRLLEFYTRKGIIHNHLQPLQVDLNALGLNLNEVAEAQIATRAVGDDFELERRPVTLRECAESVIAGINQEIQRAKEDHSVKGKRYILLHCNSPAIYGFDRLGGEDRWPKRVIQALVDQGHLFKLVKENGHGYFIQA